MKPATLAIIGTALGAAAGHAFRAPFPGMGGNPVLDLIAYHDPGLADATTPAETSRLSRRSLPGQSAAFP